MVIEIKAIWPNLKGAADFSLFKDICGYIIPMHLITQKSNFRPFTNSDHYSVQILLCQNDFPTYSKVNEMCPKYKFQYQVASEHG